MRQRSYIEPGRPQGTGRVYVRKVGSTDVESSHSIAYAAEPPKIASFITDEQGIPKKTVFRDCLHHKRVSGVYGLPTESLPHIASSVPYVSYYRNGVNPLDQRVVDIPTMVVLDRAMMAFGGYLELQQDIRPILDSYLNYSEWVMEPWVTPKASLRTNGFSLLNFGLEWKQSLKMVRDYLNVPELLTRLRVCANINEPMKAIRGISHERLTYVYGAELLVRDAITLFEIIRSWKSRADKYLANSGKQQGSHKKPVKFIGTITDTKPLPMFDIPASYAVRSDHVEIIGHATLGYIYNVREMRWWIARIAQLSDSLGVNLDAGIVWDAIPLSFVVDWYVNMGDWMHSNYSSDWVKAEVLVNDYCHSGKITFSRSLVWRVESNSAPGNVETYLYTDRTTHYDRQRDNIPLHGGVTLVDKSGEPWNVTRCINAGALTAQRVLKPRRFKGRKVSRMLGRIKRILARRKK